MEEDFKHQTSPLVSQIMQQYDAEPVNQDFLKFDLDNDFKLNEAEAQPMFRKFDILNQSIQTIEVGCTGRASEASETSLLWRKK